MGPSSLGFPRRARSEPEDHARHRADHHRRVRGLRCVRGGDGLDRLGGHMAVTKKWLEECDQFATAEYLQADAVIFLQARLKRLLKEYRSLAEEIKKA